MTPKGWLQPLAFLICPAALAGEAMDCFLVQLVTPPGLAPHFVSADRFDPGFWRLVHSPQPLNRLDAERLRAQAARALGARVVVVPTSV